MAISFQQLHEIGADCVFRDAEVPDRKPPADAKMAKGITSDFYFHPQRLEQHRQEIYDMLKQLPPQFHEESGGGWSFLNACMDVQDNLWGEQRDVEVLMCLGMALGVVEYCMPREMWHILPGGMPYFVVKKLTKGGEHNAEVLQ